MDEIEKLRAENARLWTVLELFSWALNEAERFGDIHIRVGSLSTIVTQEEAVRAHAALQSVKATKT